MLEFSIFLYGRILYICKSKIYIYCFINWLEIKLEGEVIVNNCSSIFFSQRFKFQKVFNDREKYNCKFNLQISFFFFTTLERCI